MALKVWLPLNGNLENKGENISYSLVSGNSWASTGGKTSSEALNLTKLQQLLPNNSFMSGVKEFSFSYWVKVNKAWSTQWLDGIRWISTDGSTTSTCRQEFYTNCTKVGVWYSGGSNSNKGFTPGVWTHLACTVNYNTGEVNFYKDGTLLATTTDAATTHYCRGDFYIGDNGVDILMNDFRLYDHCLSKLEVKEIAQGLMLHYKLDGFSGGAGENLLPNTNNNYQGWTNAYSSTLSVENNIITFHDISSASWKHLTVYNVGKTWGDLKGQSVTCSVDVRSDDVENFPTSRKDIQFSVSTYNGTSRVGFQAIISVLKTNISQNWTRLQGTLTLEISNFNNGTSITDTNTLGFDVYNNTTCSIQVKNLKLEIGNMATPWCPASDELGKDLTKIVDSSGYGNDGIAVNNPTIIGNLNRRYNSCTDFNGSNTYIKAGTGAKVKDAITVAWWGYMDNWASYTRAISCTEGGGWNFEKSGNYIRFTFGTGASSNTYKYATGTTTVTNMDSGWHHFVGTFDGLNSAFYFDGVQQYSQATFTTKTPLYYHASNSIIVGAEAGGGATAASSYFNGKLSDVRIYATALSADDVLALYKTSAQIDKSKTVHTFELIENNDKAIRKNGVTEVLSASEFDALSYLKYDSNLYIEPDGSVWVHIYHHNHPDLGSFTSTDTFSTSIKKDENRWFNGTQVCNQLNKWEFLIKYAFTEGGTEYKERWVQTKNPENAVFGDVDAADITRITGDGYKTGAWGGLYKKNSSAYWVMNNGNSGNWFGATGSFSIYQGGIPGYGGGTVTTTGYNDLYVRIDNVLSTVSTNGRLTKSGILIGSNFIEK